jgi:hypothetical protein
MLFFLEVAPLNFRLSHTIFWKKLREAVGDLGEELSRNSHKLGA